MEYVLCEEPCTDPYARFCGQTGAAAPSDPTAGAEALPTGRTEIAPGNLTALPPSLAVVSKADKCSSATAPALLYYMPSMALCIISIHHILVAWA